MKTTICLFLFALLTVSGACQSTTAPPIGTVLNADTVTEETFTPIETGKFWAVKDSAGAVVYHPIFQGKKGGYFIVRVSKATGKSYRQYLSIKQP